MPFVDKNHLSLFQKGDELSIAIKNEFVHMEVNEKGNNLYNKHLPHF
ncbi:hypothetical protein [Herbivorax sp. ANBcel31]